MKYRKLFENGCIGNVQLKNRVVLAPMSIGTATAQGEVSDEIIAYYEARARGGIGLIIIGAVAVDSEFGISSSGTHKVQITNERLHFAGLEKLARCLHKYDAKVLIQLQHAGRETKSHFLNGRSPVSASEVKTRFGETTHALSNDEIDTIIEKFAAAAVVARKAGFDGVELQGAHGYLISQFLSPLMNKRTDEYGGSTENRARFACRIVSLIRERCGRDFIISFRISGDQMIDGGYGLEEGAAFARLIQEAGADAINVSVGIQENSQYNREPPSFEQGWKKHIAQRIKQEVSIPVIATSTIKRPDFAETLLNDGVCDFVAIGRAALADPEWVNKTLDGKEDEIRYCISCLFCISELFALKTVKCSVNPTLLREREFAELKKDGNGRTVAVVGAGPAGLEAAYVLAMRGFNTVLFEKASTTGGQLNFACKPPYKKKIEWTMNSMERRARNAGVQIMAGVAGTVENVRAIDPCGVFVCCGSEPIRPASIPGIFGDNVCTVPEVLSGSVDLSGKRVAVIGSGLTGLETTVFLLKKGCSVSIVDMLEIGHDIYKQVFDDLMKDILPHQPALYSKHLLRAIDEHGILIVAPNGTEIAVKADAVLLAMGVRANTAVVDMFMQSFENVVTAGDCVKAGRIYEATRDGFSKAWVFQPRGI